MLSGEILSGEILSGEPPKARTLSASGLSIAAAMGLASFNMPLFGVLSTNLAVQPRAPALMVGTLLAQCASRVSIDSARQVGPLMASHAVFTASTIVVFFSLNLSSTCPVMTCSH